MSEIMAEGLVMGKVTEASSAKVPAGMVISQSPFKGTSVAPGTPINIIISSGPAKYHVPNVVGLTQKEAQAQITTAELAVGAVTPAGSAKVPIGNVISQSPAAGTALSKGAAVNLVISSGPP
jgi:serine/threonine-protein kinase